MKTVKIKRVAFILSLIILILPFGKIFAQTANKNNSKNSESKSIQKIVEEKTPLFLIKIIENSYNSIERFRENTGAYLQTQEEMAKNEIDIATKNTYVLNSSEDDSSLESPVTKPFAEVETSIFIKPVNYFKYVYFLMTSFVFQNKIFFYVMSLVIIFLFFRIFTKD